MPLVTVEEYLNDLEVIEEYLNDLEVNESKDFSDVIKTISGRNISEQINCLLKMLMIQAEIIGLIICHLPDESAQKIFNNGSLNNGCH